MQRFAFQLEYDGSPYYGWQAQKDGPSAQDAFEDAIYAITKERLRVNCAGRTDRGVHATAQVVHADIEKNLDADTLLNALNWALREEQVKVRAVWNVDEKFHARFSAQSRTYHYHILNRAAPPTLLKNTHWHVSKPLDIKAMQEAAQYFLGTHDYTTFRAKACQAKSPIKTVDEVSLKEITTLYGREITVKVHAKSFLHNQVRSMVGALVPIGKGTQNPNHIKALLEYKDRAKCPAVAPAHGLVLTAVSYGDEYPLIGQL